MKALTVILKVFGWIWLVCAGVFILIGYWGVWMKEGFSGITALLSPFNIINWLTTILTLAPGLAALYASEKLRLKAIKKA
jgi:hypothetical protein